MHSDLGSIAVIAASRMLLLSIVEATNQSTQKTEAAGSEAVVKAAAELVEKPIEVLRLTEIACHWRRWLAAFGAIVDSRVAVRTAAFVAELEQLRSAFTELAGFEVAEENRSSFIGLAVVEYSEGFAVAVELRLDADSGLEQLIVVAIVVLSLIMPGLRLTR